MRALSLWILALVFVVACGKKDEGPQPNPLAGQANLTFPNAKDVNAIEFQRMPVGSYKLKMVRTRADYTATNRADYKAVHLLTEPGEFKTANPVYSEASWKGQDQGLAPNTFRYAYQEFNFPLTIEAKGNHVELGPDHYYYNKVASHRPNDLFWAQNKDDNRGEHYLDIFKETAALPISVERRWTNLRSPLNMYVSNYGYSNFEAYGICYVSNGEVKIVMKIVRDDLDANNFVKIVELTYVR